MSALKAAQDNLREAWSALAMIRETIETLGPVGAVKASEHLDGPTFMHEAEALVEGIRALVARTTDGSTHDAELADYLADRRPDTDGDIGVIFTTGQRDLLVSRLRRQTPAVHPKFTDIERIVVDFFEASGALTEHQDAEWWVFSGGGLLGGAGISLTALALAITQARPQVSAPIEWRCFHCDEVFVDREAAKLHFGDSLQGDPICQLNAMEGGLVKLVRDQEDELQRFRTEDTATCREFYRLGAEHQQALRREEEKGYARGLSDARECNETAQESYEALVPFGNVALDILEKRPGWANPAFTANWGDAYPLRYFDFEKAAAAALKLRGIDRRPRWRHCKRQTTYVEIGRGKLQTTQILTDQTPMVLYRSNDDGTLWVRAEIEFEDGRFERLESK